MVWSVTGHDNNKNYFENALKNGQIGHAYLFSGPEMVGKKTFAYDIFKLLNGSNAENNPDFKLVSHSIEEVRNLKTFQSTKPYYGPYQVAVIDNAELLTTEASNAFLKILEEPNPSMVIFLISSKPKRLLPTVLSRCQEIKFQSLSPEEASQFIPNKLKAEDKELLTRIGAGRPGWILSNSEKIEEIKKSILEFDKTTRSGIFEKMQYAAKLNEQENYKELFDNLIYWYHGQENRSAGFLKKLIYTSNILAQSQYNHRLALENLLINS